jgi:hypothetical protein
VEHKLIFQEFIATSGGQELLKRAAASLGLRDAEFRRLLEDLPPLDLYVPSKEARLSWRGEDVVAVAATASMATAPLTAYTSRGDAVELGEIARVGRVLVLVHPAEVKGRRMHRQRALAGSTIQDPDDGEIAVQFIHESANGVRVVHDLTRDDRGRWVVMLPDGRASSLQVGSLQCDPLAIQCDPGGGSGGGGGALPPTRVRAINARQVCDIECSAANEFEFRARALNGEGQLVLQGTARITGVPSGNWDPPALDWIGDVPMIFITPNNGVTINVDVVETDLWPNPDDHFDPNPVLGLGSGTVFHIGDSRASGVFCPLGPSPCRELTVEFAW